MKQDTEESSELFFVYGTLKTDSKFAEMYDDIRVNSTKATLEGFDLFDLGWFPGIVKGAGIISGELHTYKCSRTARREFDRIEGYNAASPGTSLYVRKIATVTTEDGDKIKANVYVYNSRIGKEAKKINDGVWKN